MTRGDLDTLKTGPGIFEKILFGIRRSLQKARVGNSGDRRRCGVKSGDKLVIVGCSGSGGPAAMLAKKLMPEVDVTVIRKEEFFIVR